MQAFPSSVGTQTIQQTRATATGAAHIAVTAPRCVMVAVPVGAGWIGRLLRNHAQVDLFVGGRPHLETRVRDAWRWALSMERPS